MACCRIYLWSYCHRLDLDRSICLTTSFQAYIDRNFSDCVFWSKPVLPNHQNSQCL